MAADKTKTAAEQVTFLVFKDNFAARSFQIPLTWITQFGTLIGLLLVLTLFSGFWAVKFYRVARQADPSHALELEQELAENRSATKALETKLASALAAATAATAANTAAVNNPPPAAAKLISTAEPPVPVPAPVVTATPKAAPAAASPSGAPLIFSALPAKTIAPATDPAQISVKLDSPRVYWRGKTLTVNFGIQYVRDDKGNQQGRIVMLARGPETVLAYPDGILGHAGTEALIQPEQGEYFSVSHFREVKAEFGPVRSASVLSEVEVLILGQEGQILIHEILTPQTSASASKAAAPHKSPPAKTPAPADGVSPKAHEETQLIAPGEDQ